MYEMTHASLGGDLQAIASAVENAFNNSANVKNNGYSITFKLQMAVDHPVIPKLSPQVCEGAITSVTSILNDINNVDNTVHTVALLPCPASGYSEVFNSVNIDVPVVETRINVECAKRVAIFYEISFPHMMAAFGNALLRILDAPMNDYSSLTENIAGDDGVKQNININEPTIYGILHSPCFLSTE